MKVDQALRRLLVRLATAVILGREINLDRAGYEALRALIEQWEDENPDLVIPE
jgi:hypothetical protein